MRRLPVLHRVFVIFWVLILKYQQCFSEIPYCTFKVLVWPSPEYVGVLFE